MSLRKEYKNTCLLFRYLPTQLNKDLDQAKSELKDKTIIVNKAKEYLRKQKENLAAEISNCHLKS